MSKKTPIGKLTREYPDESVESVIFRANVEHTGLGGYFLQRPEHGLLFSPELRLWIRYPVSPTKDG